MCGLIGIAGNLVYRDENVLKRMMILSGFQRGDDSAGLGVVRKTGNEILVDKAVGAPHIELFERVRFRSLLTASTSKVFIGHTRKATYGEKTRMNAHPFEYGTVVGAHNGTLDRADVRQVADELNEHFTVDSQALIAAIAEFGAKDAIPRFRGAWSIVWYDNEDDSLNFLRNDERPMHVAWSEDRKTLIWASEIWMIDVACSTVTPELKLYSNKKGNSFFTHAPDTWYKYPVEKILNPPDGTELFKPTVRKVEGKKEVPFTRANNHGDTDPFMTISRQDGIEFGGRTNHYPRTAGRSKILDVITIHIPDDRAESQPYGFMLDRRKFDILHGKSGCDFCSNQIIYGTAGIQVFLGHDELILCPNCSRSRGTQIHVPEITEEILNKARNSSK